MKQRMFVVLVQCWKHFIGCSSISKNIIPTSYSQGSFQTNNWLTANAEMGLTSINPAGIIF